MIASVFLNKRGIFERMIIDTQKTATTSWYTQFSLPKVNEKLKEFRPHSRLNKCCLHNDNTPAHWSHLTQSFLDDFSFPFLVHSLYSTVLANCDFDWFTEIKAAERTKFYHCKQPNRSLGHGLCRSHTGKVRLDF